MKVTPEIKERIKTLNEKHGRSVIAKMLGLATMTVYRHTNNGRPPKKENYAAQWRARRQRVPVGYFDVHEKENWLV